MTDPRFSIVAERMKSIREVIAVSSGKGGVGKSLVASTLALVLAKKGFKVGLFDLDFTSPSTHIILGIGDLQPEENKGIVPPKVHGIDYMSIVYYSRDHATPLRGEDTSNVLLELLSITKWHNLDFLVLDMPPGIGDATLDMLRLIKNARFLIVTTPSVLAFETVKKLTSLLRKLKTPIVGVVENMKMSCSKIIQRQTLALGLTCLGEIWFDERVEDAIGNVDVLLKTAFADQVSKVIMKVEAFDGSPAGS